MKLETGKFCPFIGKDCIGLQCALFAQVRGTDPQSGSEVDEWACSFAWMPLLLINAAKEVRQGAAATESVRNEVVVASEKTVQAQFVIANLQGLSQIATLGQGANNGKD